MKSTVRALLCGIILTAGLSGCSDSSAPPDSSAAAPSDASTSQPPAAPQFDIKTVMEAMASALEAEAAVLRKAVHALETVSEDDRRALWAAMQDQEKAAEQIKAMLEANPTWVEQTCEWFQSTIRKPHMEVVGLRKQLLSRFSDSGIGGDWWRLLVSAAPSEDAARAHLTVMGESPGSPTNLNTVCAQVRPDKGS